MNSDGIDRYYGSGPSDPYVDTAIEQAQRAGITIYSIYSLGVGHYGHSFWRLNWGQNYLSQLSDETGGESYYLCFRLAVSFVPYLDDLTRRLAHLRAGAGNCLAIHYRDVSDASGLESWRGYLLDSSAPDELAEDWLFAGTASFELSL